LPGGGGRMADSTAWTVKDVNPHDFVKAYSAHLKRSGKVKLLHSLQI
jgi:small subunit ribosomal protein S19e